MGDVAIRVENLGKRYQIGQSKSGDFRESFSYWMNTFRGRSNKSGEKVKEFWALKDINFEIKRGEAVGIVGRNGAGKSTLLKILSRITDPSNGRFEINGRVSSLLEVGTGFHPELSGRENIYLNGTILGMKRREIKAKFDEIVAFSDVKKFIDTPVKHYSSGMKVRLAFSVAAHLEPEILIIDEVLAVGDAEFQKKCLGKMDEVSKNEGRTVLFVSHNMGVVKGLCSKGLLINSGNLEDQGDVSYIVDLYEKTNDTLASKSFSNRSDIIQNNQLIITNFSLLDLYGKKIDSCYCGQTLNIEISYEFQKSSDQANEVAVAIQFFDSKGQFITVLNNKIKGFQIDKLYRNGKIICCVEKLPFMSGRFYLNLLVQVNGKMILKVDPVASIFVMEADFFGSGFSNSLGRQGVYIDNEWDNVEA